MQDQLKLRSTFSYSWPFSPITYADEIGFIGSCFSERINLRMEELRFKVAPSFFGTLFNPRSIFHLLAPGTESVLADEKYAVNKEGNWVSYFSHSIIKSADLKELTWALQQEQARIQDIIDHGNVLFITLGSMWAYRHKKLDAIVANCHKQPQDVFNKELLDLDTECAYATQVMDAIFRLNPALKVVFTISPVKHLRDGVVENKLSKSLLRILVDRLVQTFPRNAHYFPVLEWVEEDLRDYRFYENDLAHPNKLAEDYIWQQLVHSTFDKEVVKLLPEVAAVHRQQKSNNPESQAAVRQKMKRLNKEIGVPF